MAFILSGRLLVKCDHFIAFFESVDMASGTTTTTMQAGLRTPERVTIAGTLEIPRMINGLWQLAGGHDQNVEIQSAVVAMEPL